MRNGEYTPNKKEYLHSKDGKSIVKFSFPAWDLIRSSRYGYAVDECQPLSLPLVVDY
jgi:hypothetical protein